MPITTAHPNDLWTADFKGHFRTRDGVYCYPLTVADQHTRYLLACHGLLSTKGLGVRPVFDRLFREYGLPRAIRTDNGVPFATTGIHGLSQLNVWWLRLGIQHQRMVTHRRAGRFDQRLRPALSEELRDWRRDCAARFHRQVHQTFGAGTLGNLGQFVDLRARCAGHARCSQARRPCRRRRPSRQRRGTRCPRTTAPTSFSSISKRTSGLSEPKRSIASR